MQVTDAAARSTHAATRPRSRPTSSDRSSASHDPIDRVDRLIHDIRSGTIHYAPEIARNIRKHALTLGHFPCQKYILHPSAREIDARDLPTEIVARGEKPRYKNSVTIQSKLTAKQNRENLRQRMKSINSWTNELQRQRTESIMVLIEGDNADGKDGMLKHVFRLSPLTTTGVRAFKAASGVEKRHKPNWRIMRSLCGPGQIGFHNRTAYGDVVFASPTPARKAQRIADIKEMEFGLTMGLPMTPEGRIALPDAKGRVDPSAIQRPPMRFIKVLLGLSMPEQAARLAARLMDESKLDKESPADVQGHPDHLIVQSGYANAMAATSTPWAPTYYIPNDNKPLGWRKMSQIVDGVLADMNPQRPHARLSAKERARVAQPLLEEANGARNKW